jgi:hypothetical protein
VAVFFGMQPVIGPSAKNRKYTNLIIKNPEIRLKKLLKGGVNRAELRGARKRNSRFPYQFALSAKRNSTGNSLIRGWDKLSSPPEPCRARASMARGPPRALGDTGTSLTNFALTKFAFEK